MKFPRPLAVVALLTFLGLAPTALAQSPAPAGGPPPLSAEQRQAMAAVKGEFEKKAAPFALRVAGTAKRIYENMLSEKPNEALRQKLSQELSEAVAGVLAVKGQAFWDAVKVLTPEQKDFLRREMAKPDVEGDLGEVIARLFNLPK